jgi:hypothetical protein
LNGNTAGLNGNTGGGFDASNGASAWNGNNVPSTSFRKSSFKKSVTRLDSVSFQQSKCCFSI